MVTPNDATPPAQTTLPHATHRLDGSVSARLWHFRLMRASLRSGINPAAFAFRWASFRPLPARTTGTRSLPSSDTRHDAGARNSA